MTHLQFYMVLTIYLLLVAADFAIPPRSVTLEYPPWIQALSRTGRLVTAAFLIVLVSTAVVGFVGMFFFWGMAVYLFFGAVAIRNVVEYACEHAGQKKGLDAALQHGTVAFEFAMALIIYVGPARGLLYE